MTITLDTFLEISNDSTFLTGPLAMPKKDKLLSSFQVVVWDRYKIFQKR